MPEINNQWIKADASDGTEYLREVKARVTKEGVFVIEVPDDIAETVRTKYNGSAAFHPKHSRGKLRLEADELRDGIKFLCDCAKDYITVETVTERLILYGCKLNLSFWIDGEGKICPNGYSHGTRTGNWWKPKMHRDSIDSSHCVDLYSIGIGAVVMDRITHKRESGDKIEWKRVRESDETEIDQEILDLNAFCAVTIDPEEHSDHLRTMPYTPKAAKFFHDVVVALCQMGKSIDDFFSDDKRLLLAIQNQIALPFGSPR